ncbi:MAG TPA: amidohydrolase family protein [Chloroflexota bacterium]|nr:amidohydrolase family protein [Chloroflexota bacterium]
MTTTTIDTLIRGAKIVDGAGNPWRYGDVALAGERVLDITPPGQVPAAAARQVVEAAGMVVCPGFIDIQSHSIIPLMVDGRCLSKITQGVTTEIMGEAWTPAPVGGRFTEPMPHTAHADRIKEWLALAPTWRRFGDWLAAVERHGVSPNFGSFLGAGTLREYAKGMDAGPADAGDLDTMRRVMAEAMEDGAFGVSYALIYPPDCYASTDEIVEVCKVVARYGGVYITHIRSEADQLLEALEEALAIGRRASLPVEIYHLKAAGAANWSKMPAVIERIDRARAAGQDVTADMYPYAASGTGLSAVLPPWTAAEGKLFANLADPAMRRRIREAMLDPAGGAEMLSSGRDAAGIMPIGFERPEHQQYVGKRLSEIAAARGQDWIETVFDLLLAERQRIATIYFSMQEDNLPLQLRQPWIKVSTDAGGVDPAWAAEHGPVHPRGYGAYPRVLGKYVREQGVLTPEDAIRKMTSAVADRLQLRDRGLLRAGCFADVVVFDPANINDNATFAQPHQLSTGIRDVWVNGVRVLADGDHTGAKPGRRVGMGG